MLTAHGFISDGGQGSHRKLVYRHPDNPDDVRVVPVPMHPELAPGTLSNIAELAGADDVDSFCDWLDATL